MRNTLFLNLLVLLCYVGGPTVAYRAAMRQPRKWRRWQVLVWCAAGGAVAASVLLGTLILGGVLPTAPLRYVLRASLRNAGWYALFGLLLGFAGLAPRAAGTARLVVMGLVMVALLSAARLAIAAHGAPATGASGVVMGPDGRPAAGAAVYFDRGSGPVERITTDATGAFHTVRAPSGARQPLLLICVPGAIPYVALVDEYIITPRSYEVPALPERALVTPGIRALGWQQPIPRECLAGSAER